MSTALRAQLDAKLASFTDLTTGEPLLTTATLGETRLSDGQLSVELILGYPALSQRETLRAALADQLKTLEGVRDVQLKLRFEAPVNRVARDMAGLAKVRNIVAVASGKGGVGKSTVAVNLALALVAEGARVGLLDADIYGPSQQLMLGVGPEQRPQQVQQKYFAPVMAHGVASMSMGYLVTEQTPMVWRGPMASGALLQILTQTWWDELDYLIIDMPPGTGDIQLTLTQKVPVAGAIIVTTPQDIALADARKGIEMFRKVDVPVLGMVENMAVHVCSQCGHREHIFGEGGGARIARQYEAPLLGALPLALSIREGADTGRPVVVSDPQGDAAQAFLQIARAMGAALARRGQAPSAFPEIQISDD
ncbi:MAG TPA: iron-sulfur cluster carrier protein ApbC [Spongiibacteraceae bacterium]|jgi:ATP-binding protein involved in chromosome partitioning|nr:iron-sulfur cluster carrier protein ApbC [Spongiibacteraceae bacterium]HUH38158.1 iron-sulfur cluster carrier protein ApbC [Spongiibacteraceae bacterium]